LSEESLSADYGLLRPNFSLKPTEDPGIFVGRPDVKERLESRLLRAINTQTTFSTIIFGDYGSGKTHALNYVVYFLKEKKLDMEPIFVRQPKLSEKSTPADLFTSIINSISIDRVFDLLRKTGEALEKDLRKAEDLSDRVKIIDTLVGYRDLSVIINKFLEEKVDEYLVRKWFSGQKLSGKEKSQLGVVSDTFDPYAAAQVATALFGLLRKITHKEILLMLDEMEGIVEVRAKRQPEFSNFLRPLLEETSGISVLMAFSHKGTIGEGPLIFQPDQPVGGRVGYPQNYIHLMEFNSMESTERFIKELLSAEGIRKTDLGSLVSRAKKRTNETVTNDYYPFTKEAVQAIFQLTVEQSSILLLPRVILKILTSCLGEAIQQRKPVIDSQIVQRVLTEIASESEEVERKEAFWSTSLQEKFKSLEEGRRRESEAKRDI